MGTTSRLLIVGTALLIPGVLTIAPSLSADQTLTPLTPDELIEKVTSSYNSLESYRDIGVYREYGTYLQRFENSFTRDRGFKVEVFGDGQRQVVWEDSGGIRVYIKSANGEELIYSLGDKGTFEGFGIYPYYLPQIFMLRLFYGLDDLRRGTSRVEVSDLPTGEKVYLLVKELDGGPVEMYWVSPSTFHIIRYDRYRAGMPPAPFHARASLEFGDVELNPALAPSALTFRLPAVYSLKRMVLEVFLTFPALMVIAPFLAAVSIFLISAYAIKLRTGRAETKTTA